MRGQGTSSYAGSRLLVLFAMALSALLVLPAIASADYVWRTQFFEFTTSEHGKYLQPSRVAVEQSTGNVFVIERDTGRVLVFGPSGIVSTVDQDPTDPLTEFGSEALVKPFGIAIEESGGQTQVYVSDAGGNEIIRFSSDEAAVPSFSVDATFVSPAQGGEADEVESFAAPLAIAPNGDLWVADSGANEIKRFDPTGAHVGGSNVDGSSSPEGEFTGLTDLAVNSAGDLYVIDATGPGELGKEEGTTRVQRFDASGAYKATLGPLGPNNRSAIVAVNPANGDVAVSGDQKNGEQTRFFLFDSADAPVEELVASYSYTQGGSYRGAAFHGSDRNPLYFAIGHSWYFREELGEWTEDTGWPSLHVFSELFPPTFAIDPASGVTSDSATISGQLDPQGIPSQWQVEFRQSGASEWEKSGLRSGGETEDPVPVSEELEGLVPGQEYEARLAASTSDGSGVSDVITFTTDTAAPRVISQSADAGTGGATLRARIHPGGLEATYHFEYGPTDSYGQSTPEQTIPAGNGEVNVAAAIDGLQPGVTYHFKVVAENTEDTVHGGDRTFTTLASEVDTCPNAQYRTGAEAQLSDCRAYELVTPEGSEGEIRVGGAPSTPDGNTVCFNTEFPLAGSDANGIKVADDGFCATRGAGGWDTEWVTGPAPKERQANLGANVYFLSPDGRRAVFASDEFLLSPDYMPEQGASHSTQIRAYMWEDGVTSELSPPRPFVFGDLKIYLPENSGLHRRPLATSEDLTRGIFLSTTGLVPEDVNFGADIYEWSPDGLRLISTADGSAAAAGGEPAFVETGRQTMGTGLMSADGSRIFFHHKGAALDAEAEPGEEPGDLQSVYMREGDEVTLVTPRDGATAGEEFRFAAASSDGETVYVESIQEADNQQSGKEIYVYDVSEGELEPFASRPGGTEVLGISDDGSTVVYRSMGSFQVYLIRDGETTLLGTLGPKERAVWQNSPIETPFRLGSYRPDQRALRFTADGSSFVFVSAGEFGAPSSGVAQVYRWSEEDGLQSISAAGASEPTKNASIGAYGTLTAGDPREEFLHEHRYKALEGRVMSDDGSRIFFETPEALVDRDENGIVDVYEWRDGDVDLVSSGTGSGKALYHDSSADGRTVFFTTFDRLDPERDRNNTRDVYVAQPGGGYPPLPVTPSCQGEGCQPERPAPAAEGSGSGAVDEGNVAPGPQIKALGKKQLKRLAKSGRTTVRVVVGEPGRVTALLKARIKGRSSTVARATKSASGAGAVSLSLKLSKAAWQQLRKRGTLRLTLEVTHSRSDQTARKAVMLRG